MSREGKGMRKNAVKLLLMSGAFLFVLGGCKKEPSAAAIMREAVANANEVESFAGHLTMDAGLGIDEDGKTVELDTEIDMDIEAVRETGAYHMKGSVEAELADISVDMELYHVPGRKESEYMIYTKVGNTWTAEKKDAKEEDGIAALMNPESFLEKGSKLKLEKEVEKKDGREVYVITAQAGGSCFRSAGDFVKDLVGSIGGELNFKDSKIPITFRVYKDTMLPASISMTLSEENGNGITFSDESGNEIVLNKLTFSLDFIEYNHVDKIVAPEEALDARLDSMDIMEDLEKNDSEILAETEPEPELRKDKDGNYILLDWKKRNGISIPVREGMRADQYSDDTCLILYKDGEKPYSAEYTLETLYEPEEKQFYIESKLSAKEMYEENEEYSDIQYQEEQEIEADGRKITYVSLSYTYDETLYRNEVYAWTMIDDEHMLVCEIGEYPEEKGDYAINSDVIQMLFEGIKS